MSAPQAGQSRAPRMQPPQKRWPQLARTQSWYSDLLGALEEERCWNGVSAAGATRQLATRKVCRGSLAYQLHCSIPLPPPRSLAQHAVVLAQLGLPAAAKTQGAGGRWRSGSACCRASSFLRLLLGRRLCRPCRTGSGGGSGRNRDATHPRQEGAARLCGPCMISSCTSRAGDGCGWRRRALLFGVDGGCAARVAGVCRWRRRRGSPGRSGSLAAPLGPQVAKWTRHGGRLRRCRMQGQRVARGSSSQSLRAAAIAVQ